MSERKKLTQSELAEKLGVTDKSISNWENGRNMPDISLFKPLCDILGISINDFISVLNIKQAPRFTIYKISSDNAIYYDTLFYDVIRCNKNEKNEYFKVLKKHKYDKDNIENYCK